MRLSFVQRLRNEKHETLPTRESEEKSKPQSVRIKSNSLSHHQPKSEVFEHCNDIKQLLSILEETKNPEFEVNTPKILNKTKTEQDKQIYNEMSFIRQEKNEKFNKVARPVSSRLANRDNKIQLDHKEKSIKKTIDENAFCGFSLTRMNYEQKQENQQNFLDSSSPNKFMMPYRFPGNRKPQHQTVTLPPIGINKRTEPRLIQNTKKPQFIASQQKPQKVMLTSIQQKKRGLQNIGNTCYINSTIQCLFHLSSFNGYLLNRKYLEDLGESTQRQQQEQKQKQKFNSDRSIVEKYRDLFLYVMKGESAENDPKKSTFSLKLALSKSCSLFLDWEQQDAHEFMRKLLDSMHQEINRSITPTAYKLLKTRTKLQYSSISSLADEYFQYYKQKDDSYIYDCFGGQLYNNIECINCHSQSISFENCLDVSLPLVKGKNGLEQLLGEFFGKQRLGDFYKCEDCNKTSKNSIKTTKFWRTPTILIIQLKRSQFGRKNLQPITFPIDMLSLHPYINTENDKVSQKYSNYTLKSVVCHRGAADGGHYWSLIREYGQWFEVDDEKVRRVEQEKVRRGFQVEGSQEAYILFYESMSR